MSYELEMGTVLEWASKDGVIFEMLRKPEGYYIEVRQGEQGLVSYLAAELFYTEPFRSERLKEATTKFNEVVSRAKAQGTLYAVACAAAVEGWQSAEKYHDVD